MESIIQLLSNFSLLGFRAGDEVLEGDDGEARFSHGVNMDVQCGGLDVAQLNPVRIIIYNPIVY